jgi:hypothetical protein
MKRHTDHPEPAERELADRIEQGRAEAALERRHP